MTLQAVHGTYEVCAAGTWAALSEKKAASEGALADAAGWAALQRRSTVLVFIGRGLKRTQLEAALRACRAEEEGEVASEIASVAVS